MMLTTLRRPLVLALVLLSLLALTVDGQHALASEADLFVAPGATGDCSVSDPCGDLNSAVQRGFSGAVIEVADGSYPQQTIDELTASWSDNLLIRPAAGTQPTFEGIEIKAARVTLHGFRSTGLVRLYRQANHVQVREMFFDGASAVVAGPDGVRLVGNRIRPAEGQDGLQIKHDYHTDDISVGVTIENNVIGPGRRKGTSHTDCIQTLAGDRIVIRNNVLLPCANAALMLGGSETRAVLVEGNFIGECKPRTTTCDGHHAAIIGSVNAGYVTMVHNSINGSVAIAGTESFNGFAAYGNIADSLPCTSNVDWNLTLSGTCGDNDRTGSPDWADPTTMDLHLRPGSPAIDVGSPYAPHRDIEGETTDAAPDLGADEYVGGATTGPTPSPSPSEDPSPSEAPTTDSGNSITDRPADGPEQGVLAAVRDEGTTAGLMFADGPTWPSRQRWSGRLPCYWGTRNQHMISRRVCWD